MEKVETETETETTETETEIEIDTDSDRDTDTDIDSEMETATETETKKETTLAELFKDTDQRVWECPTRLDGKSLRAGRHVMKKFPDGWAKGVIKRYTRKKNCNCDVQFLDEPGSRDMMLDRKEYFSSVLDHEAVLGSLLNVVNCGE